jgi:hypothetical protein
MAVHRVFDRITHIGLGQTRPRFAADPCYLDLLAHRLAAAAHLPLETARRRVLALAISAQPKPSTGSFQDRGRS